jgi:hypothetical protein
MAERTDSRLVATFDDAGALVAAARAVRAQGLAVADAHTPFPLHELDDALGVRPSRLGRVTFAGGLAGALGAIALQVGTAVVDWPLNVGGKPAHSALAFVPITFELTILVAGLATAAAFLWRSRLFPGAAARLPAPGVTDGTFALVLEEAGGRTAEARELLFACGAHDVLGGER